MVKEEGFLDKSLNRKRIKLLLFNINLKDYFLKVIYKKYINLLKFKLTINYKL